MNRIPPFLSLPIRLAILLGTALDINVASGAGAAWPATLGEALTFRASFDHGADADTALGDPKLYWASSMSKRQEAQAGLPPTGEILLEKQGERGALVFTKKKSPIVFFQAAKNVAYAPSDWSGTVSFWLKVDPGTQLEAGFCDPIQITPRAWNDAAFFVEFEKKKDSIPFRLGVYPDVKVWNPNNRDWNSIPLAEKPLFAVEKPPFAGSKWIHVLFTFERFNNQKPDGSARLYLEGKEAGALIPREQTFRWDLDHTAIMLGLSYIGAFDELSIYNRALTAGEIAQVHDLTHPEANVPKSR